MSTTYSISAEQFLESCRQTMSRNPVMHHTFLTTFEKQSLSREQLKRFAIQWYKAAKAHKEAFPALIYNVRDDDVRFELIDILNEEYGNGNREKIHARLLFNFLKALGISEQEVATAATLPAVSRFADEVLQIWRDGSPASYAFGLHFALEYLAAALHTHFANGLERYKFLTENDIEYFTYHRIAEQRHADYSEIGFTRYAEDINSRPYLQAGIEKGIDLLQEFWDDFYFHIFGDQANAISA
jgi:pyrroloquinoline quinone (PQQ) biosynthesis protein C